MNEPGSMLTPEQKSLISAAH